MIRKGHMINKINRWKIKLEALNYLLVYKIIIASEGKICTYLNNNEQNASIRIWIIASSIYFNHYYLNFSLFTMRFISFISTLKFVKGYHNRDFSVNDLTFVWLLLLGSEILLLLWLQVLQSVLEILLVLWLLVLHG